MPTINANLVPTVAPGGLFNKFVTDTSLNVRWLTPEDPAYYEILNRPLSDIVVRQLVMAKALDQLNTAIGFLALFPFVNQPKVEKGGSSQDIPIRIFWDSHFSLNDKWGHIRLARVDRVSGENTGSSFTGTLRFIFTGNEVTEGTESTTEVALFYADYEIDSSLTYQIVRIIPADSSSDITGFANQIPTGDSSTLGGTIVFKTADTTLADIMAFLDFVAPGTDNLYSVVSTTGADTDDDFSTLALSHGTGLLTSSAYNGIVSLDSDPLNWIEAQNYPFALDATRESETSVTIPDGLFVEFNMVAPAGDEPTGDTSGTYYPVWVSSVTRDGDDMILTFSTFNVSDTPDATTPVEFATLTLQQDMTGGDIVAIESTSDLLLGSGSEEALRNQDFGQGHVVLSRKWDLTGGSVSEFFESLPEVSNGVNTVTFTVAATRLSSFALSRVPRFIPSKGQSQALQGTSGRFDTAIDPSDTNRYVTEKDEGLGDTVDLDNTTGITSHAAISRYGYKGTRVHESIKLVVDPTKMSGSTFYEDEILPRLIELYGRSPVFGDEWYNGTKFMKFNGDAWVG